VNRWRLELDLSIVASFAAEPVMTSLLGAYDLALVNGRVRRGGTDPLQQPSPDEMHLLVYDPNRVLDPSNATSPLGWALDARRRVRLWARHNLLEPEGADFESGTGGWVVGANTTITQAATPVPAASGLRMLAMTAIGAGDIAAASDLAPVQPGATYYGSVAIRAETTARQAAMALYWYAQDGTTIVSTSVGPFSAEIVGAWWPLTHNAAAPAGAAWCRAGPYVVGCAAGERHSVDQAGLAKGSGSWEEQLFTGYVERWDYDSVARMVTLTAVASPTLLASTADVVSRFEAEVKASSNPPVDWFRMGEPSNQNETWAWVPAQNIGRSGTPGGYVYKPARGEAPLVSYDPTTAVRFSALQNSAVGSQLYAYLGWRFPSDITVTFWLRMDTIGPTALTLGQLIRTDQPTLRYVYWRVVESTSANAGRLELIQESSRYAVIAPTVIARSSVRVDDGLPHRVCLVMGPSGPASAIIDGVNATALGVAGSAWGMHDLQLSVGNPLNNAIEPVMGDLALYDRVVSLVEEQVFFAAGSGGGRGEGSLARAAWLLQHFSLPDWLYERGSSHEEVGPVILGNGGGLDYLWRTILTERGRAYVERRGGAIRLLPRPFDGVAPVVARSYANDGTIAGAVRYDQGSPSSSLDDVINVVEVELVDGSTVTVRDEQSIDRYLELPFRPGQLLHLFPDQATAFGRRILAERAQRTRRLRQVVIDTRAGMTERREAARTELGDYVRARHTPKGGGATLDQYAWVEGVTHEFDSGMTWTAAVDLWPAYDAPVAFTRAASSVPVATTSGQWTPIPMNSESQDDDGMHSVVSNTSRFYVMVTGVHRMHGFVQFAANGAGRRGVAIVANGATFLGDQLLPRPTDVVGVVLEVFVELPLVMGDYVELWGLQESGGPLNIEVATGVSPELRIAR
jgi:hypothetical protein